MASNIFDELMADMEREDARAQVDQFEPETPTGNMFDYLDRAEPQPGPARPSLIRSALDVGQGVLNVAGAGAGAIAGGVTGLFGSDAYGRALEENLAARGPAETDNVGFFEALRSAPGAGQVLAEAALPGEQQTATGRIAKRVGGLVGDIAGDPANWVTGGLTGAKTALRAGEYVPAAAKAFGSATAGAVYLPEIVQGAYGAGSEAVRAAREGDYGRAGEYGLEAALMGGLGGAALHGVRSEARGLRAPLTDAGSVGAPASAIPDFAEDFPQPQAPSRVNWTPEQEATYRGAFDRQQATAPVQDRDFFTSPEPQPRDTFGELLAELDKNNPTVIPEPPPVTLPPGFQDPDVWGGPVPPGFEAPGTPTDALLTDVGSPAGPPRLAGGPGVRLSPESILAGERAAFDEAAPVPYQPPPLEPEVLGPPVTDRDFLAPEAEGLLGGQVIDVPGRPVVPELTGGPLSGLSTLDDLIAQRLQRLSGVPEQRVVAAPAERAALPEAPDPLTAALEAALAQPAGPPRLAVPPISPRLPDAQSATSRVQDSRQIPEAGRIEPEAGTPVLDTPLSTERGQEPIVDTVTPTATVDLAPRIAPGEAPKGQHPVDENGVPIPPQFAHLGSAQRQGILSAAEAYADEIDQLTKNVPPRPRGVRGDLTTPPEYRDAVIHPAVRSHLRGTPLEPLMGKYTPKQIVEALRRDKNNKIEQEVLALVSEDPRAAQMAQEWEQGRSRVEPTFGTTPEERVEYRDTIFSAASQKFPDDGSTGIRPYEDADGSTWFVHRDDEGRMGGVARIDAKNELTDWGSTDPIAGGSLALRALRKGATFNPDHLSADTAALVNEYAARPGRVGDHVREVLKRHGRPVPEVGPAPRGGVRGPRRGEPTAYGELPLRPGDVLGRGDAEGPRGPVPAPRELAAPSDRTPAAPPEALSEPKYATRKRETEEYVPELTALHNLTTENLLNADRLGGLAVPSIAITRGKVHEGYGDITLVGDRRMIDPKERSENKVYPADAYTGRYPDTIFKARKGAAQKLLDTTPRKEFGEIGDEGWDALQESPTKAQEYARHSLSLKAAFLRARGVEAAPIINPEPVRYEISHDPGLQQFYTDARARGVNLRDLRPDQPEWADFSMAVREAINRHKFAPEDAALDADIRAANVSQAFDENGLLEFGPADRIIRDVVSATEKRMRLDRRATDDALDSEIAKLPKGSYEDWLKEQFSPLFSGEFVKIGRKKVPISLEAIVEAMRRSGQNTEKTMTFGPGNARAAALRPFPSVERMREARESIVPNEAFQEWKDKTDALHEDMRSALLPFGSGDTWNDLDNLYRALADYLKSPATGSRYAPRSLRAHGFRLPEGTDAGRAALQKFYAVATALEEAPTEYFEAKPTRAVGLEEFRGAAIPDDAAPEVRTLLAKRGIPYEVYPRGDAAARQAAVDKLVSAGDARFASRPQEGATPLPGITAKEVKRAFAAGEVREAGEGAWEVSLPGDRKVNVRVRPDGIEYDATAFSRGYGREKGAAEEIVGSWQKVGKGGLVFLSKQADQGTVDHESFHAAMDLALTPKEKKAVLRKFGDEEKAAEAFAKWQPDKQANGYFAKIVRFFRNLYRTFRPSWESAFERTRSGEAYGKRAVPGSERTAFATTAFHGSPHDFDRFDLGKVGTGEGAQAYGHGLYFSGKRDVAEFYKNKLSRPSFTYDGREVTPDTDPILSKALAYVEPDNFGGDMRAAVANEVRTLRQHADNQDSQGADALASLTRHQADVLEQIDPAKLSRRKGRLYEVELAPDEGDYLDWDKPLSEQSEKVQAALVGAMERDPKIGRTLAQLFGWGDPADASAGPVHSAPGSAIYQAISSSDSGGFGSGKQGASMYLQRLGIPGIRYLDQSSRAAGEGTRNYVIFDDSLVTTKSKYATRPAPGQRGLPGVAEDVAQPAERKRGPEQRSMFGGEMLQGVERRGTEGREAEGPLFTQEQDARAKAEREAQGTLPDFGTKHPETGRKYSSTQVDLPPEIGRRMAALSDKIPESEISTDPKGSGVEKDHHVTVKFGLETNDADAVRAALAGEGPVRVAFGKTSLFPAKEGANYDVLKIDVDSPDLHRLNAKIRAAIATTDTHPTYEPHATLAYLKPGEGKKYVGRDPLAGQSVMLDKITFSTRDGREIAIPLSVTKYATAPAQPPQMPPQRPRPTAVPTQPQPARAFSLPEETFIRKAQRYVQDRLNRVGVVQESVRQQGGRVRDDIKAAADALSPKVAERFRDLDEKIVNPLTKALSQDRLSLKDLDQYLYARHAPTRNAVIAQRNQGVSDGSGMSDAEANRILADFQARGLTPKLQRAEAFVRAARDEQIRVLLDGGLISQGQATSWKNTMGDEYVPLRSVEVDEGIGTGSGFDIRGKEAKSATGRGSLADSPTSAMLQQLQRAIVRAEKNKVDQRFARFVEDNGLFDMDKDHTRRELDARGQVRDVRDTLRDAEDFSYKVNGERHRIDIASKDPLLDRAMKNLSAKETGEFVQRIGSLTRLYSQMVTSWNPEFVATNFARDIQTALANVSAEQSGKIAAKMAGNVPKAMKAMYQSLRSPNATGPWVQIAKEFREDGGSVGWYSVKDIPALEKSLQTKIKLAGPGALNRARAIARSLGTLVEDVNKTVESGTRLALYKALRDAGVSREKAATTARNVTIDFNKKGEAGPAMNALYAFFNANIQGGKRLAEVVTTKRGAAVAGGVAAMGFALDQYNRAVAEDANNDGTNDYDDIPEYVKERNLVIMRGEGQKPLLVPMPYGFNVIHTAGRQASAVAAGTVKPGEAAMNTGASLVNAFNPLGSESNLVQILSPTFLDPLVQDVMNKDFAGRNIRPEQFPTETKKPDSELYFKNVSPIARELARVLNEKTGGDKVTPGFIDASPETMQHYWNFLSGGLGRFAGNVAATGEALATGETPSVRNIPFARRFAYEASPGLTGQKYREQAEELDQLMTRYKTYTKERNRAKLAEIPKPMLRVAQKFEFIERQIRQIRKAEKDGRIKNADARIESLRRLGNRLYAQASESS